MRTAHRIPACWEQSCLASHLCIRHLFPRRPASPHRCLLLNLLANHLCPGSPKCSQSPRHTYRTPGFPNNPATAEGPPGPRGDGGHQQVSALTDQLPRHTRC